MANVKLVYINSTGGYVQSTATNDVAQALGKLELTGVSGVAIDAGAAKISNLAAPVSGSDAATKDYVDNVALGLSWKSPVRAVSTAAITLAGTQTVDGVALIAGDRILVAGQAGASASSANGIYVVASGSYSRATDADASGELNGGTAVFITEGTSYADSQWVLTTNNPIVVGTTPITFAQFGGGSSYSAGDGLILTGTTFSVKGHAASAINVDATNGVQVVADTGKGISVSASGVALDLAATPGLEFSTGDLRIKIASANELSLDSNGLNVEGVPTQFNIGASAVSSNVTATNLNALTDSSTITALHRHNAVIFSATASLSLGQGFPVYFDGSGSVYNAEANIAQAKSGVVGIALEATSGGNVGPIQSHGMCSVFTSLTAGLPYHLPDSQGTPVLYSAITSGNRAIRIGYALNSTTIQVNIQDMGVKP